MTRSVGMLLLALAGLVTLPQAALAGQFKKPVYYSAPGLPLGIVTADFDGDTNLDLAIADFGDGVVRTLLGRGDGGFRTGPSFSIAAPYAPLALAVGDFNGDGALDLAVVEYNGPADGRLGIFLGKGDGTFHKSAEYNLGYEPSSAAVADFDGDGHLDVVVTNPGVKGNGSVMVFFGKGDGTFKGPTIRNLSAYPFSVAAGDLNGDGRPDLAVAESNAGVAILLNRGGGKFGKPVVYPVRPAAIANVVIAELNGDNYPDLVVATFQAVGVLLGKGGGKFRKAKLYSTLPVFTGSPLAVVVADFNLDGSPDIATVLEAGNSALFYGKVDGTFKTAVPIRLNQNSGGRGIASGDFNKDDAPDLAILETEGYVAVFLDSQ
jgi:hypothetical protein